MLDGRRHRVPGAVRVGGVLKLMVVVLSSGRAVQSLMVTVGMVVGGNYPGRCR